MDLKSVSQTRDDIYAVGLITGLALTEAECYNEAIHVYNSLMIAIAVGRSKLLDKARWIKITSHVLAISIILSTVFLKQHSILDAICAFAIAAVAYYLVYVLEIFTRRK